jgi:putative oxidoreductase
MQTVLRWLLSPGATTPIPPLVARVVLAAVFIPIGLGKFVNHDTYIERFDRWGIPEPSLSSYLAGTTEVACGLLMLVGLLPRPAGFGILGVMAGAFLTAGLQDGGQDLWLPPVLAVVAIYVIVTGTGRFGLHERLLPRTRTAGHG